MKLRPILLISLTAGIPFLIAAQIIQVKTYPVLSDNSMFQLPSSNAGLGGITFALRDELYEPFRNPAGLMNAKQGMVFFLPRWSRWQSAKTGGFSYDGNVYGGGSTFSTDRNASNAQLSSGVLYKQEKYAFILTANYQRLHSSFSDGMIGSPMNTSSFNAENYPLMFSLGAAVAENVFIGASYNYVPLKGIDGIQFLYPGSQTVNISGMMRDMRVGISARFTSSQFDAVVGRNIFEASHGASYEWSPVIENKDENKNIFSQLVYTRQLSERLQLAATATANWKELPKLPNYPVAGIPRDPGYTRAFNLGAGASWNMHTTLFAVEYVYEPISSDTWVEALEDRTFGERKIYKGERERENNYDFHNHIVRVGLQLQPEEWLRVQFGSEMHSYSYAYQMKDYINRFERQSSPENEWTEITLTGGAILHYENMQLAYNIEFLTGRGILSQNSWVWRTTTGALASSDFMLVPNDFLSVQPVNVVSHRVTIVFFL